MNRATLDFIRQHQDDDVRKLAFLGSKCPDVVMPFALDQIRGRKMARAKLPRWASIEGIIYPPHISMEQCSSEQTAQYKAELAARLLGLSPSDSFDAEKGQERQKSKKYEFASEGTVDSECAKNEGTPEKQQILIKSEADVDDLKESLLREDSSAEMDSSNEIEFIDLTGGFGVDFSYIATRLGMKSMYVERQVYLCGTAKENFERLGLRNIIVKNGDGVEILHAMNHLRLIFIDPARRDDAGNKVVSLQDCTPDVTQLQDEMLAKADYIIIKLSPMLDWHRAVRELKRVKEVHIVSTNNECKELLLVLSAKNMCECLRIFCVNDVQKFVCDKQSMASAVVKIASLINADRNTNADIDTNTDDSTNTIMNTNTMQCQYLYEPNASLMKAGCFGILSERYDVKMLAKNSHLFVSSELVDAFPGRTFRILAISSFNKKELKKYLAGITKANITTRNFPLSVAELRKRLKLKDGGDTYIFATTLSNESHVLVIATKN